MVDQQPGQIINPNDPQNSVPEQPIASQPESVMQPNTQPQQVVTPPQVQPEIQQNNPSPVAEPQQPTVNYNPPQPTNPEELIQAAQEQSGPIASQQPQELTQGPVQQEPNASAFNTTGFDDAASSSYDVDNQFSENTYDGYEGEVPDSVTWTASEYISHHKSSAWFLGLAVVITIASAVVFMLTKDVLSAIVIVVVGIVFGMYAGRKPQELTYIVNNEGVFIGDKIFTYDKFKSFSIVQEGPVTSIVFAPMGRFMPFISIYYDPQDEDRIANTLSAYLPYENYKRDPIDTLMRKIRF